jgi:hypothetical protein
MSVKGEKIHQFCKISALIGVFPALTDYFSDLIEAVFCHHPAP